MLAPAHFMVGGTLAVEVSQPRSLSEAIPVFLIGGVSGIWADCDMGNSKVSKLATKIIRFSLPVLVLMFLLQSKGFSFSNMQSVIRILLVITAVAGTTVVNRVHKHRGPTHWLVTVLGIVVACWFIMPKLTLIVGIGLLSHVGLDLLNEKAIALFAPFSKKKFKLGLCKSNGIVNAILPILCIAVLFYRHLTINFK